MLIRKVILENYGIYGGIHEIDLEPRSDEHYDRPIVLFSGKNGAGKTTYLEAIKLCLHGSLALGRRVSRAKYKEHLARRIHRSFLAGHPTEEIGGDGAAPVNVEDRSASVAMEFDFVDAGELVRYRVERRWHTTSGGDVSEQVTILEDDEPPRDLDEDDKDHFLRDLISPSALELFFFDGERLQALAADEINNTLLASTIRALLGIHLVEQLESDLDVYIGRRLTEEAPIEVAREIEEFETVLSDLLTEKETDIPERQLENISEIESTREAIAHQEELIAREGGTYAIRQDTLKQRRSELEQEIDLQRRRVQEMCSGLMPFSVAPKLGKRVLKRLETELEYKNWRAAQKVLERQIRTVNRELKKASFWADDFDDFASEMRDILRSRVTGLLRASLPKCDIDESEVILRVSEPDRIKLTSWVNEAITEIPSQFAEATNRFLELEKELATAKAELEKTPDDLILQPLVETLRGLEKKLERLQKSHDDLAESLGSVTYKIEQTEGRIRNLRETVKQERLREVRLDLARRAQDALASYSKSLMREKLRQLETAALERFNELNRKGELVTRIEIDAGTFHINLARGEESFGRAELSEGEKQLLAVALVWALRDISDMPLPVVIDTPLGRLDSDHRANMIQKYFPRASHQVILLATDTEIDDERMSLLAPAVSHAYRLEFDEELARTVVLPFEIEEAIAQS